jgi:enoyl-CoA hydratase/carnithine racemase
MAEPEVSAGPAERPPETDMVLYEVIDEHIARITLNRPHRRNAILMPDMNIELHEKFEVAQDDDAIKVIVLAATGPHFCSGEDVNRVPVETFGLKKGERLPQSRRIRGIVKGRTDGPGLLTCDKTVIAAVQGAAFGLGFNLALSCDMIIAADDALFSRRQTRIGFGGFDMLLPVVLLKLGINRGYEIILTGRKVTAADLYDWGVVSSVVPIDDLADETLRYARAVAAHSTDGLMIGRQAKKLFWDMMGLPQWNDFVAIGHPLFTNLVWREDETNLLKERARTGNAREALDAVHRRWEELGFE